MAKMLKKLFWAHFFVHPHYSNGTKTCLDTAVSLDLPRLM